jgi:hypothetical protein
MRPIKRISGVRPAPPPDRGREVDEEFAFHLAMRTERLIADGSSPAWARAEAERQFGDMTDAMTYCRATDHRRETRRVRTDLLFDFAHDLRYSARSLRKAPAFVTIAVLTLALGIGANVAIFGMSRGVLIDPIPVPSPRGLVALYQTNAGGAPANQISYGHVDLRARTDLFDGVALIETAGATVIDARGRIG